MGSRSLVLILLACLCSSALGSGNSPIIQQRDAGDTTNIMRILAVPAGDSLIAYDSATSRPTTWLLGSGLTLTSGVLAGFSGAYGSLTGVPSTFAPAAHTQSWSTITSAPSTLAGYGITDAYPLSGNPSAFLTSAALSGYATTASLSAYATTSALTSGLAGKANSATTCAGYGITDCVTSASLTSALASYATTASLASYLTTATAASTYATQSALTSGLAAKLNTPSGTTAQYVRGDGTLATLPTATPFTFSQPSARTLVVSTSYQATDPSKAAILYPSYACTNATQVLASSACTAQVRMGTGALTCSTGTVYYTQSLTVNLGVLLTQNSTNPVPIFLPIGGSLIICATAGTFTITAVEQSAG